MDYGALVFDDKEKYKQIKFEYIENYPENFGTLYEEGINYISLKFDEAISKYNETDFLLGAFENENLVAICGGIQEKKPRQSILLRLAKCT